MGHVGTHSNMVQRIIRNVFIRNLCLICSRTVSMSQLKKQQNKQRFIIKTFLTWPR